MASRDFESAVRGAIFGLAVGDALGVPAEFMSRDDLESAPVTGMRSGGAHGQEAGTWSDDTSMTLSVMEAFALGGGSDEEIMELFGGWLFRNERTARGKTFDVGNACLDAISKFARGVPPSECGGLAESSCGNGSLMRIMPTALLLLSKNENAVLDESTANVIHDSSRLTHAHRRCLMACGVYCAVAFELFRGRGAGEACAAGVKSALEYYNGNGFADIAGEFGRLPAIGGLGRAEIKSGGFVLHTLEAALWCLVTTEGYAECVLKAVNLGDDADTTAAVAGALAGLCYGEEAIPEEWLSALARREYIGELCGSFSLGVQRSI